MSKQASAALSDRPEMSAAIVETEIPARLDRLPWGAFPTLNLMAARAFFYNAVFFTYAIAGALLAATGYLFMEGTLDATTQTVAGRSPSSSRRLRPVRPIRP